MQPHMPGHRHSGLFYLHSSSYKFAWTSVEFTILESVGLSFHLRSQSYSTGDYKSNNDTVEKTKPLYTAELKPTSQNLQLIAF